MSDIITYQHCPICNSAKIEFRLSAIDNTVTKEAFEIWECTDCTARFTQRVPSANAIGKYYKSQDYISHSDTKKGIVNKLYHWVRSYTLSAKKRLIRKLTTLKKGILLDVGAGTGAFASTMQKAGWQVTGLEPDETARQIAKQQYQLELSSPDNLHQQPSENFDAITMWHVLEHVHDLHGYFKTFQRILKLQGTLIIAVPNYTSFDADAYQQHWAAYDVPRHLYHFSPHSMDILAEQHGMQVVAHKPMWFDSFYVSMLSEQYKNGYNNIVAALWNGWLSNWEAFSDTSKCSSVIYVLRKSA
jgi:2-polyprenyl-3-methyl-5-hydroxy-6-metoxy-1,4-benzoquinol methylase